MNEREYRPEILLFNFDKIEDISEVVSSFRVQNDIKTPVSTASFTINPAISLKGGLGNITHERIVSEWRKKIKINSVISIRMDKHSKHLFLGLVDHKSDSVTSDGSATGRTLTVNCSLLLPKMLMRDNIANSPVLSTHEKIKKELGSRTDFWGWMRGLTKDGKSPFAGYPEDAVKWILENAPATVAEYDGGFKPKDFFQDGQSKTDITGQPFLDFRFLEGEYLFDVNLSRYSGTIYNYIMSCLDEDFYEMFFDTTTGDKGLAYNRMVIRPKPFGFNNYAYKNDVFTNWMNFEELEVLDIPRDLILRQELGINDYEMKNMFSVNFVNSLIANATNYLGHFGIQFPVLNLKSIKKYGLRELQLKSQLINLIKIADKYNAQVKEAIDGDKEFPTLDKISESEEYSGNKSLLDYLIDKRDKAVEWYGFPYFESGQITVIGSDRYRIGKAVYLPEKIYIDEETGAEYKGVYYYLKNVTHLWNYGTRPTASLGLTRGIPKDYAGNWLNENKDNFVGINIRDYLPTATPTKAREDYAKIKEQLGKMTVYEEKDL
jgi:hypothetical protein